MKKMLLSFVVLLLFVSTNNVLAQNYFATAEGFEQTGVWPTSAVATASTHTATTGTWTVLSMLRRTTTTFAGGGAAQVNASGYLITPQLNSGVGTLTITSRSSTTTTRIVTVATSVDGIAYTNFGTYNATGAYVTNNIVINSATAKYVRITTPSGGGVYHDDIQVTQNCTTPTPFTVNSGSLSMCVGASVNITTSGSQTGVTYELYKDGVATGTTQSGTGIALSFSVSPSAISTYTVRTTNAGGFCTTILSGSSTVTILAAPAITSQNTPGASYGENFPTPAALTVTATGAGLSYQWYSSTDAATNTSGDDVAVGSNSNSFTPPTTPQGTLYYYCVVSGTCTPAATSAISGAITIVPSCTAPTFSVQPTDLQVECVGGTLTLGTVVADQSPTYQWYSNSAKSNVGGTSVGSGNGGSTDTYTPPSTTPGTYYYYVVATNGACPTPSNAVEITIDGPSISSQNTPAASYSIGGSASALTVTATGSGLSYQWYSSLDASNNTPGNDVAVGTNSNSYTPSTSSLGVTYYYCVVSGTCPPSIKSAVSGAITIVQYAVGDFGSLGSGNWGANNANWRQWNGTAFATVPASAPTLNDNVFILPGHIVNVEVSAKTCKNLTVEGTLKSSNLVNTPSYVRVYGTTLTVNTGGLIGNNNTGDAADGISLDVYNNGGTLTITGNGGSINFSRMKPNFSGTTVVVDHDMTLHYHGSTNQGGHTTSYYPNAATVDNTVLTVNAGKTLTLAPWSALGTTSSSNGIPATSMTVNVNGTLTLQDAPAPNAGAVGATNSFIYGGTAAGDVFTLNVGSTGIVNTPQIYPNGTVSGGAVGTGADAVINVAAGGQLNVSKTADFRKPTQTVTGGGTFSIQSGATLRIGSPDGITASPTALGNIQTATRSYSPSANYSYEGSAAQVSGDGLPSSVNNFTVNNAAGLTLQSSTSVSGAITLTSGALTVSAGKTLTPAGAVTHNFNGQLVTFKSDASGTASLGTVSGTLSGASNVTVERYIPNNGFRSWRLLSIPTVSSQTINASWQEGNAPLANGTPGYGTSITGPLGTNGLDTISTKASMLRYTGTAWADITSTAGAISAEKAYFIYVRGDRSKSVTGAIANSNATTLRTNGAIYSGDQGVAATTGFSLIPNLYPSAIDFTGLTRSGVANLFYIWDSKKLNGTSLGVYQTFSSTNGFVPLIAGGSYSTSAPNTAIESGQAFFVQGGAGGSVTLHESAKISTTSGNLGLRPVTPTPNVRAKFDVRIYSNNIMVDANAVVFNNAYSNEVKEEDAAKYSNPGENFAVVVDGNDYLAIEGRKLPNDGDVINFSMWNMKQQTYKLEIIASNMEGVTATLEDSYLKTSTAIDMTTNTNYSFTVDATAESKAANRFKIVFSKVKPIVPLYSIAPNPIVNGNMNVVFTNKAAGNYTISIVDNAGKTIKSTVVSHAGGSSNYKVKLPATATGTYITKIIAPYNTKAVIKAIVAE